jgi:hypothetical protein
MIQNLNVGYFCLAQLINGSLSINPIIKAGKAGEGVWLWTGGEHIFWLPDVELKDGTITRDGEVWAWINDIYDQPEIIDPAAVAAGMAISRAGDMTWLEAEVKAHAGAGANA